MATEKLNIGVGDILSIFFNKPLVYIEGIKKGVVFFLIFTLTIVENFFRGFEE